MEDMGLEMKIAQLAHAHRLWSRLWQACFYECFACTVIDTFLSQQQAEARAAIKVSAGRPGKREFRRRDSLLSVRDHTIKFVYT